MLATASWSQMKRKDGLFQQLQKSFWFKGYFLIFPRQHSPFTSTMWSREMSVWTLVWSLRESTFVKFLPSQYTLGFDFLFIEGFFVFWASLASFQLFGHLTFDDCVCPLGSSCWTLGILLSREAQWSQWRRRQREFSKALGTAELRNSALPFTQSEASGEVWFGFLYLEFAFSLPGPVDFNCRKE